MPATIVVVGCGILGTSAALLAADRGHRVRVIEKSARPWSGASAAGEGKVHLGLIYALGDASTQAHILRGALSFSRVLDRAAGMVLPWSDLVGEQFLNVVMPSSLLSTDELAERYRELDEQFHASTLAASAEYLGEPLARLHEPGLVTEPLTGLPALRVAERAVEPARLRRILVDRLRQHPNIELVMNREVLGFADARGGVDVQHRDALDGTAPVATERAAAVVNCSWESQAALHADPEQSPLSLRYKASVSIPIDGLDPDACRSMTLVIGPFGDVVRRATDVYVSWYPVGRIVNELGFEPTAEARARVASLDATNPVVDEQLDALVGLGALPRLDRSARARVRLTGGWIIADGAATSDARDGALLDVDDLGSALHDRRDGTIARRGRVISPRNWKLSTAPLAALKSVDALDALLAEGMPE